MQYGTDLANDFIERTFAIIKQYDELEISNEEKYEITLRINCLFSLIIIAKAKYYKNLSFCICKKGRYYEIKLDKDAAQEKVKAKIVMHCLRNGLAHWMENESSENVQFGYNEDDGEISNIKIRGSGRIEGTQYNIELSLNKVPEGIDEFLREIHENLKERN